MQQQVFDAYAATYDDHFTNSLIGKAQRKQVYRHANNNAYFFRKCVLEVNCGTGEDAIWLANQGANVLATDVSKEMLKVARSKVTDKDIEFKQLSAQAIGTLAPEKYGSIFSNFGGLNCLTENELIQFKNGCVMLQGYEDQLVFVVMGTKCIWEKLYFYFKKDTEKAKRRLDRQGVETVIGTSQFRTYYYSPNQIKKIFKEHYYHLATKPVGLFVPPSYLEPYFKNRNGLFFILKLLDRLFGSISFFSNYADHYLIVFEKK